MKDTKEPRGVDHIILLRIRPWSVCDLRKPWLDRDPISILIVTWVWPERDWGTPWPDSDHDLTVTQTRMILCNLSWTPSLSIYLHPFNTQCTICGHLFLRFAFGWLTIALWHTVAVKRARITNSKGKHHAIFVVPHACRIPFPFRSCFGIGVIFVTSSALSHELVSIHLGTLDSSCFSSSVQPLYNLRTFVAWLRNGVSHSKSREMVWNWCRFMALSNKLYHDITWCNMI